MMASAPAYTAYAEQVLMPAMDADVLAEIKELEAAGDTENPRYMEPLVPHFYERHSLRMPAEQWPDPVRRGFAHINPEIYVPMQGPSELGMSPDATLAQWDRVECCSELRTDPCHRGPLRHDGPGAYGDDGPAVTAW